MIDFKSKFASLEKGILNNQKKLDVFAGLKVFYGVNQSGNIRLSFLSSIPAPKFISTRTIFIEQGLEGKNNYWTNFDLTDNLASEVFYSFCNDMVMSILDLADERVCFKNLSNHFNMWKKMFKKELSVGLSYETAKGLYGELFILDKYLLEKFGEVKAIEGWTGGDNLSKDFAIEDTWFEVKTTSPKSNVIEISSLTQLDASTNGYLIIVKVETMAECYDDGLCRLTHLFNSIMAKLNTIEMKDKFIDKVIKCGFIPGNSLDEKYVFRYVKDSFYIISQEFPRLREEDIRFKEINNVTYSLIINALERFKVTTDEI